MNDQTTVERTSEREVVVTRLINGPPRLVFEAWTNAELFQRCWVPASFRQNLRSCELDVRVGGGYRLVFEVDGTSMAFFGRYLEVTPGARLVWTNDEGGEDVAAITTVTFEARGDRTLITLRDLHPSKEALEASGSTEALPESFRQLDELITGLAPAA